MPLAIIPFLVLAAAPAPAPQANPRERIRFDAGWRFQRLPEASDWPIKGPFEWEYRPATATALDQVPEEGEGWRPIKLGELPLKASGTFGLFRTELGTWPENREKILRFDSVDDNAAVYLNGKLLGTHRGYGQAFSLPFGSAWKSGGPNRLVVLIENTGGEGGINGGVMFEGQEATGPAPEEARPEFRDNGWRTVHLPHDYVVEGTFSPNEDVGHGSLPKPKAWYRKTFTVSPANSGKTAWLEFDGVYRNAEVYLNGERLGKEPSGYIGFRFDLSKRLRYGATNTLAVHVDPSKDEGWWYEGGGIYRHVWLTFADPAHVEPDTVFVRTELAGEEDAIVRISGAAVVADGSQDVIKLEHRILSPEGKQLARMSIEGRPSPDGRLSSEPLIRIAQPQLWSVETPTLYTLESVVMRDGKVVDSVTTPFGIRSIRWDKDLGFLLNGKPVKLKGTCNHQDHAGVGIAIPDRLFDWRIKRLKEMGSNAYRCAHNPPAKELLDACDRLGMLVLDETRHLGDATTPKSPSGTPFDSLSELRRMILRDRNHPSIIGWSLYNEEPLQETEEGARIFAAMARVVKELDGTRVCTGATNSGFSSGIVSVSEVFGLNYNIQDYDAVHARFPNLPLFGSETASTVSTRGEYENDPAKGYVSAYDRNAPAWANMAEQAWRPIAERPWMAGAFVWTGFDYRGEPTPYSWPNVSSHFGILDTCGFPKDNFYYYKAQWDPKPLVHLLPHWNWAGKEGQPIEVWAHSNAEQVELFLNGNSLGAKEVPKYGHAEWSVPYQPGKLEARGYRDGKVIAKDVVETAGSPVAIRLKTTVTELLADNEDLSPVDVEIIDARGRVVPTADHPVTFEILGAGEVRGVGNGDPSSHEPDKASSRRAFHGLCAVYVGAKGGPGGLTLRATSPGLKSGTLRLRSRAVNFPRD